jgi:hypothetical protein
MARPSKFSPNTSLILALSLAITSCSHTTTIPQTNQLYADVHQWDIFQVSYPGPTTGNPFQDVHLFANFISDEKLITVRGFYDGNGIYRIRFMPPTQGTWTFQTQSNIDSLNKKTGRFVCDDPTPNNHGLVQVANTYHFQYNDGTPFWAMGTTLYGWSQEPDDLVNQTLTTLKNSPFNKVRMILTPKKPVPGLDESVQYPYEKLPNGKFDFQTFNPKFFQRQETHIRQLRDIGIEADVILFNPYDSLHLGFNNLSRANDEKYLQYVIARFGAYHNVWWSLANEYDHIHSKTEADWDHLFQVVQSEDPYSHLRSIHNDGKFYDYNKPWVTHLSIQNGAALADFGRATLYRDLVRKPLVFDEICYEGHLDRRWGQLSAEEMTFRFWQATIAGAYATHGETLPGKTNSWTPAGGVLIGHSLPRLAFLKSILESAPPTGIDPIDQYYETNTGGKPGEYYLLYFGKDQPKNWPFKLFRDGLKTGMTFHIDLIDTWNMTITPLPETYTIKKQDMYFFTTQGNKIVPLPSKPYLALRITRINTPTTQTTDQPEGPANGE